MIDTDYKEFLPEFVLFARRNKKVGQTKQPIGIAHCTLSTAEDVIKYTIRSVKNMHASLSSVDFHTKEVSYHQKCKRDFQYKATKPCNQNMSVNLRMNMVGCLEPLNIISLKAHACDDNL